MSSRLKDRHVTCHQWLAAECGDWSSCADPSSGDDEVQLGILNLQHEGACLAAELR